MLPDTSSTVALANANHGTLQSNYTQGGSHNQQFNNAQTVNVYDTSSAKQHIEALKWLAAPDPSSNHATARDRHQSGTCNWLLQKEQYKAWRAGVTRILWLHGKPGCGKSVLCSTVVEDIISLHMDSTEVFVAYFYLSFSDDHKQSYLDMLSSIVCQIASREPGRSLLHDLHGRSGHRKPALHELDRLLANATANLKEFILILDAVDESPERSGLQRELLRQLRALLSSMPKLRLFATSRDLVDIRGCMESLQCDQIAISSGDVSDDIQHHVETELATEQRLKEFTPAIKDLIKANVSQNADGMFRWASLLLDEMASLRIASRSTIATALRRFPKDLDAVYCQMLEALEHDYHDHGLTLLRWITYAQRPLQLDELVDAIIIKPECDVVDFQDRCLPADILRILTSLIVVVTETDGFQAISATTSVRLAHFTVQEYLESNRILDSSARRFRLEEKVSHSALARSCLTYLMHYSRSEDKTFSENDKTEFPLLCYAAEAWYCHSWLCDHDTAGLDVKMLKSDAAMDDWLAIHNPDGPCHPPSLGWTPDGLSCDSRDDEPGGNLYYASLLGLERAVEILSGECRANVNAQGGHYSNALQAAVAGEFVDVAKLLLQSGADVHAEACRYGNALLTASEYPDCRMVKLLLDYGADANIAAPVYYCDSSYRFYMAAHLQVPLQVAAGKGCVESVELLLSKKANVNTVLDNSGSALQAACSSETDRIDIVRVLLNAGADVNGIGVGRDTPLLLASANGHMETVRYLVENGANRHRSALEAAYKGGHANIVRLLQEKGVRIDTPRLEELIKETAQSGPSEAMAILFEMLGGIRDHAILVAAFRIAVGHGQAETMAWLLKAGVNIEREESLRYASLEAAAQAGHVRTVELLLESCLEINVQHSRYGVALHLASSNRCLPIVQRLLKSRIVFSAGDHREAIHAATRGHLDGSWRLSNDDTGDGRIAAGSKQAQIVELLIHSMLQTDVDEQHLGYALKAAAGYGHCEMVKKLLKSGAPIHEDETEHESALHIALLNGHGEVADLLLSADTQLCSRPHRYHSALHVAASAERRDMVEALLASSTDINVGERKHGHDTTLHAAAVGGYTNILKLLIKDGARIHARNQHNWNTTLQAVIQHADASFTRALLEPGAEVTNEGLQAACKAGRIEVIKMLLTKLDPSTHTLNKAFRVAALAGNAEIMKLLVTYGADFTVGDDRSNPLLHAVCAGPDNVQCTDFRSKQDPQQIVQILLDLNFDVNKPGGEYGYALQAAASKGYDHTVELLLAYKAAVNARGGMYGSALRAACNCFGHRIRIVRCLLDAGADIDTGGGLRGDALTDASHCNQLAILKMFLEGDGVFKKGETASAIAESLSGPLRAASDGGHVGIVSLLLKHGADGRSDGALEAAVRYGHVRVMNMLLDAGAQFHIEIGRYDDMLLEASQCGRRKVVELLLERKIDVNLVGDYYGTALRTASAAGHIDIVKLLLSHGANIHAKTLASEGLADKIDGDVGERKIEASNALHAACASRENRIKTVKLLLAWGSDVNEPGGVFGNALQGASYYGYADVVALLLNHGAVVNAVGGRFNTALQSAAARGHVEVVQQLFKAGAEPNAAGGYYGNALQAALYNNHVEIARLLLEKGANVNAKGGEYGSALQAACASSCNVNTGTVSMLLEHGAEVNSSGGRHGSPIQAAATRCDIEILDLLMARGACVESRRKAYSTALEAATHRKDVKIIEMLIAKVLEAGSPKDTLTKALRAACRYPATSSPEITRLLLDAGADMSDQDEGDGDALQAACASSGDTLEIVEFLIERGASIDARGGRYDTALQAACTNSRIEVVELLLDSGASLNLEGGMHDNALTAACLRSQIDVIALLLKKGAKLDLKGQNYGTALRAACSDHLYGSKEDTEIIELLLAHGADVNAADAVLGSALQAAMTSNRHGAARLLLEAGADVNVAGGKYGNALQAACANWKSRTEHIHMLLDHRADVHAQGGQFGHALQAASSNSKWEFVDLLLAAGADINAVGGEYGTALQAACTSHMRCTTLVRNLLDRGAEINAQCGKYGTALQAAAARDHISAVELLLRRGADINIRSGKHGSALGAARAAGHHGMAKLLIKRGAIE